MILRIAITVGIENKNKLSKIDSLSEKKYEKILKNINKNVNIAKNSTIIKAEYPNIFKNIEWINIPENGIRTIFKFSIKGLKELLNSKNARYFING